MGAAIDAVGDTGKILRHNPVLTAGGTALTVAFFVLAMIVNVLLALTVGWIPLLGQLIQWVVVALLLSAFMPGLIGMAYEGRDGDTGIGAFFSNAADGFLPYFGAYLILTVGQIVLAVGLAVVVFVVGLGGAGIADAGGGSTGSLLAGFGVIAVVFLVVGLLVLVVGLLIQFFDIAIVADGAGPVSAFSKSAGLVTSAPLSAVGYSVIRILIVGVVSVLPYVLLVVLGSGAAGVGAAMDSPGAVVGAFGTVVLVGFAVWFLVVLPLSFVVNFTYHAAFYNRQQALGNV